MLACTSCKSKENAISRCNDCANFLCASCDNAHQYMRCFENHEVVKLDAISDSSSDKVTIHKPLYCNVHTSENLKYYCFNCQMPVCNDCLIADHKGADHHYESIADAEKGMRSEIEGLMKEANLKLDYCNKASVNLDSSLHELQNQHDTARGLIEETYQSFKAILEKCRENSLKDLERLHSERELKIMDLMHVVEKSTDRFENACKFTTKVLEQANGPELSCLKKIISSQFLNLINDTPKADVNYSIEFDTKYEKFEVLSKDTFGKFRTEVTPPSPKESTPPPTLPGMPPILISKQSHMSQMNGICNSSQGTLTGSSVTASSPISLPTSMQSSFDGDMSGMNNGFMLSSTVLTPDTSPQQHLQNQQQQQQQIQLSTNSQTQPPVSAVVGGPSSSSSSSATSANVISGLTSIAEYNLHRLANLAETSDFSDQLSSVVNQQPTPSPTPQFTLADFLSGDTNAFNNLQALAKLGMNQQSGNLLYDFNVVGTNNHKNTTTTNTSNNILVRQMNSSSNNNSFENVIQNNSKQDNNNRQRRHEFNSLVNNENRQTSTNTTMTSRQNQIYSQLNEYYDSHSLLEFSPNIW